ncbi:MAG: hypothetical protein Nk1A_7410 [Endomicrobiia bacterium]|nr:MAG: hypothetical protein Nk1A_7410 [Endomicrobiia bacterium]
MVGEGKEYRLKEALDEIKREYDYVIIDTPPALSTLTINALVASSSVVIASQAERLNLSGISRIEKVIETVCKYCNENLIVRGILLTRFKKRTRLNRKTARAISEAQMMQQSIFDYDLKSNITKIIKLLWKNF